MRAYHFLPATWALDDIAKQRIKISEIDQTDDPFSCGASASQIESSRWAPRVQRKMSENTD